MLEFVIYLSQKTVCAQNEHDCELKNITRDALRIYNNLLDKIEMRDKIIDDLWNYTLIRIENIWASARTQNEYSKLIKSQNKIIENLQAELQATKEQGSKSLIIAEKSLTIAEYSLTIAENRSVIAEQGPTDCSAEEFFDCSSEFFDCRTEFFDCVT